MVCGSELQGRKPVLGTLDVTAEQFAEKVNSKPLLVAQALLPVLVLPHLSSLHSHEWLCYSTFSANCEAATHKNNSGAKPLVAQRITVRHLFRVGLVQCFAEFAAVDFGILPDLAFQFLRVVVPAFQMPAAEFSLGIFLIAGALLGLSHFYFFRAPWASARRQSVRRVRTIRIISILLESFLPSHVAVLVGQALLPVRLCCGEIALDRQECLSHLAI